MDEKEKLSTLAVVPLYKQLKRLLEDALNDGTWKPGESLPSEPELAREYGVSRITVRTALNELSKEPAGHFPLHRAGRQRGPGGPPSSPGISGGQGNPPSSGGWRSADLCSGSSSPGLFLSAG